ncbi:DUF1405 domain-containing protein [Aeribacillus pallidus]|uniref:DUF1405 domain-containing protein n=1 Tax=Aeribacillus pallidus TaxID=33936 RepID=UPI001022EEB7|nr:DUF1405 domain-containing protein [Aeribacillus pallidus]RZI53069.1 DUF1405 domain-containing protein [Aeribacillus pallidus]
MGWLFFLLRQRSFLYLMLIINTAGTIYGYIWYKQQLSETPPQFIAFVPDSPTASLFFVFVLIGFLVGKHFKLFEALAMITLFKYGIWAVAMNLFVYLETGVLSIYGMMLILSHLGMAIEGLLYAPYYRFEMKHLMLASIWTLHNEIIDYVFDMMPQYSVLNQYSALIGYFTFWLSIISIAIAYFFVIKNQTYKFELKEL